MSGRSREGSVTRFKIGGLIPFRRVGVFSLFNAQTYFWRPEEL